MSGSAQKSEVPKPTSAPSPWLRNRISPAPQNIRREPSQGPELTNQNKSSQKSEAVQELVKASRPLMVNQVNQKRGKSRLSQSPVVFKKIQPLSGQSQSKLQSNPQQNNIEAKDDVKVGKRIVVPDDAVRREDLRDDSKKLEAALLLKARRFSFANPSFLHFNQQETSLQVPKLPSPNSKSVQSANQDPQLNKNVLGCQSETELTDFISRNSQKLSKSASYNIATAVEQNESKIMSDLPSGGGNSHFGVGKRILFRWGADGSRMPKRLNSSRFEDDGKSHSIGSQYTIDTEARFKLKNILQKVFLFGASRKQMFELDDMVEDRPTKLEDPNPDYEEGIFFVPVRDWGQILRCRERKVSVKICVYDAKPLFLFKHTSRLRQLVVNFTESTEFQNFTILVIMLTTVTLIIYDYSDRNSNTHHNQILDKINAYSTYFYLAEFLLKLVTQGVFLHANSFFREGWNWLDFLVVMSGLTEITSLPNVPVKGLRAFRVIRPLRSIKQFPRLRKLISGLISSIPPLLNTLVFMSFVFIQFSIFASYQFAGAYYNRCRLPSGVVDGVWPIDPAQPRLCSKLGKGYTCQNGSICGEPQDVGLQYTSDPKDAFTNYRITNFDNPFIGLLTIFQCITLDGWSEIMYNIKDQQEPSVVIIFFVFLVVIGAFFLIHMILAVINYSIQQFENQEIVAENLKKQSIAISLKRKEKHLKLDEQQDFHANLKKQKQQDAVQIEENSNSIEDLNRQLETQREEAEYEQKVDFQPFSSIDTETPFAIKDQELKFIAERQKMAQLNNENLVQDSTEREDFTSENLVGHPNSKQPERTSKNKLYYYSYKICTNPFFSFVFTLIIVINAALMTLDRFPEPQKLPKILEVLNQLCSWLFTAEMIIKLLGLGLVEYARDRFNLFDAFIVILSIVDSVMFSFSGVKIGSGVIILRSIRLLRVFKLARNWTSFRVLLARIVNTMPNIITFGFLLAIFIVVFTILGMQFFAGTVFIDENDNLVKVHQGQPPLNNFESLYNATTTVFVVMMLDNWHATMFDYYRGDGIGAQIYFIATITVLNFILLNLFLALIIENFDDKEEGQEEQDSDQLVLYSLKVINFLRAFSKKFPWLRDRLNIASKLKEIEDFVAKKSDHKVDAPDPIIAEINLRVSQNGSQYAQEATLVRNRVRIDQLKVVQKRKRALSIAQQVKIDSEYQPEVKSLVRLPTYIVGKSLFIFDFDHPLRRLSCKIFDHRFFDNASNFVVVVNTLLLAIDNPLDDPLSPKQKALTILDYVTTSLFSLEAAIKILLFGFIFNGSKSYIRLPWNALDFFVIVVSVISYLPLGANLQFYKAMRMLRILRPLRMIQRNQGLRIAIRSLVNMLPGIFSLVLISCINMGLMAVLGVNLFMGTFYSCDMSNIPGQLHSEVANMWDCMDYGGEWVNAERNFDNFWQAFLAVFQITNVENWFAIALKAQQRTQIFQMPRPMASPASMIYFVIVILVQAVFMFNLFVQVVISVFNLEKEKLSHSTYLTNLEYEYIDTCIKCYKIGPQKVFSSAQPISKLCFKITTSKIFQNFIFVCILVNSMLLATNWYGQSQSMMNNIELVNKVLIGIFSVEVVLNITAHRRDFFRDGWQLLDLAVVCFGILGYVIQALGGQNVILALTVIRLFKVTRLFKLVKALSTLKQITMTFFESFGEILNIGSLLFLFLFMFVILAMNLFAPIKLQTYLNDDVNFQRFGVAFLSLFRASTGEDWTNLMADLSRQPSIAFQCKKRQSHSEMQLDGIQGCGSPFTQMFFTVFQVVMTFIMFNLFTAIILEGFSKELLNESQRLRPETLQSFQLCWQKYDPGATGMIRLEDLKELILDLTCRELQTIAKNPRGLSNTDILFNFRNRTILKLSAIWHLKENDGSVQFQQLTNNVYFQRQLNLHLQQFIADLQIPTYNKIQNFNFYDVLISFIDFQFSQRHKIEYQVRLKLQSDLQKISQTALGFEKIKLFSEEYFKLPRNEKEILYEKSTEDFIHVIHSIEQKSKREDIQILKLIQMKELKRKNAKRNQPYLDQYEGNVIDSKYILAVSVIQRGVKQWKEKRNIKRTPSNEKDNCTTTQNNSRKKALKIMPEYVQKLKLPSLSEIGENVLTYLKEMQRNSGAVKQKQQQIYDLEEEPPETQGKVQSRNISSEDQSSSINSEESYSGTSSSPSEISRQATFQIAKPLVQNKESVSWPSPLLVNSEPAEVKSVPKKVRSQKLKKNPKNKLKGKLKAKTVKVYGNPAIYAHFSVTRKRPIRKVHNEIASKGQRWKVTNAAKRLGGRSKLKANTHTPLIPLEANVKDADLGSQSSAQTPLFQKDKNLKPSIEFERPRNLD